MQVDSKKSETFKNGLEIMEYSFHVINVASAASFILLIELFPDNICKVSSFTFVGWQTTSCFSNQC